MTESAQWANSVEMNLRAEKKTFIGLRLILISQEHWRFRKITLLEPLTLKLPMFPMEERPVSCLLNNSITQ